MPAPAAPLVATFAAAMISFGGRWRGSARRRLGRFLSTLATRVAGESGGLADRPGYSEAAIRESEERYRILAESVSDMIFRTGMDATRLYVSPASRDVLGYEPEELVGTPFTSLTHPDDAPMVQSAWTALVAGNVSEQTLRYRLLHKQGHWVWCESRRRLLYGRDGAPTEAVSIVRDISDRVRMEEQLQELARTDVLTGLPNRRAFDERLQEEWDRGLRHQTPLALLYVDVDLFKEFNDQFGHPAGDECLKRVAEILRHQRRATDLVARVGGEEFALLLPHTDLAGATILAEVVRNRLRDVRIPHPRSPFGTVSASFGVAAIVPELASGVSTLTDAADRALYDAKRAGRNRIAIQTQSDGEAATRV